MRSCQISPEQYKTGEKNYRMLKGLLESTQLISVSFMLQISGLKEIPDEELRQVKGRISDVLRIGERPFASFAYLEYDEEERHQRELRNQISQKTPTNLDNPQVAVKNALSQAFGAIESINMQTELGIIPSGLYCPSPFKIALDSCAILGVTYETRPMASPSHR